jgi:hypothetical protein
VPLVVVTGIVIIVLTVVVILIHVNVISKQLIIAHSAVAIMIAVVVTLNK